MESPRLEIDSDNIAWIVFEDPDSKVNLLNPATVGRLDNILDNLTRHPPRAVIFISGKPDIFIAGADIKELEKIRDAAHGEELSTAGHRIFGKIERLGVPTVVGIHGACLGGGCELALACQCRVATDDRKTRIGLPETQLGIIPGWGGTQRLPRLIGLPAAVDIIAAGKSVDGVEAFRLGLVDSVVPVIVLRETVRKYAFGTLKPSRKSVSWFNTWPVPPIVCSIGRKKVLARTRGHYPAPMRAIDAIEKGIAIGNVEEGLKIEAKIFGEVAASPQSKNLLRVFFLREKYSKLRVERASGPYERGDGRDGRSTIQKVGVLGAGIMGAGIAQWCSARGITVRLKDISPECVAGGMKRIADAYRDGVKRHSITELEMQHGLARVHPTTDYTGFADCDLVIEAVLEKIELKRALFNELAPVIRPDCILASNTSAIPIDDLAAIARRPDRFVGIHFFNPVHKMPLVEVVRGTGTSPETLAGAVEFVKQLKKMPVIVRGTPGFLVNRLLMPYLNEAGVMVGDGVGVEPIDRAMLDFGMPMGPLRLIDEVGIDVAFDVAHELAGAFRDRMTVAPILERLHRDGLKGRKGGTGFYVYDGKTETVNPKIAALVNGGAGARPDRSEPRPPSGGDIQRRLLGVMIAEAKRCLNEAVIASEDDIEAGMIFGTGFPPFRGGLVKYARDAVLW